MRVPLQSQPWRIAPPWHARASAGEATQRCAGMLQPRYPAGDHVQMRKAFHDLLVSALCRAEYEEQDLVPEVVVTGAQGRQRALTGGSAGAVRGALPPPPPQQAA